jgi:hypothetical protein
MTVTAFRRPPSTPLGRIADKFRWLSINSPLQFAAIEMATDRQIAKYCSESGVTPPGFEPAPEAQALIDAGITPERPRRDDDPAAVLERVYPTLSTKARDLIADVACACSPVEKHRRAALAERFGRVDLDNPHQLASAIARLLHTVAAFASDPATAGRDYTADRAAEKADNRTYIARRRDLDARIAHALSLASLTTTMYDTGPTPTVRPELRHAALAGAYDRLSVTDREQVLQFALGLEAFRQQNPQPILQAIGQWLRVDAGLAELLYFSKAASAMLAKWAKAAGTTRPAFPQAGRPRKGGHG